MNNNQFRKLLLDQSSPRNDASTNAASTAVASKFGSKKSSVVPMTPRNVKGGVDVDFARQVRERNATLNPPRKFKSSVPKGSKLLAGYTDRSKIRQAAGEAEDDKEQRIKALEEQMKLDQISREMFETLRDQITGGEISNTHLVKGLDWKLLERVRRGEDVFKNGPQAVTPALNVDDELAKFEEREVEAVKKESVEKKGSTAGRKRTRDEIMAELKAQRTAAKEAGQAESTSNNVKRNEPVPKPHIKIDHKGREVIMVVGEDGVVKKKVRKLVARTDHDGEHSKAVKAGSTVPAAEALSWADGARSGAKDDDDDNDIFAGAGTEYNPLGGRSDDSDDDEEDVLDENEWEDDNKDQEQDATSRNGSNLDRAKEDSQLSEPEDNGKLRHEPGVGSATMVTQPPRNYFKDEPTAEGTEQLDRLAGLKNILHKAAKMDSARSLDEDGEPEDQEQRARLKRRAQMLAQEDRDLDDMDMGFGGSRYEDDEDAGDRKVRLSQWKEGDGGDVVEGRHTGEGHHGKRKRKPKTRKGDVNNIDDIMKVVESRRSGVK